MNTNYRRTLVFAVIIVLLTLSSYFYEFATTSVKAAETTIQDKGRAILTNVVGLDYRKYSVTTETYSIDSAHQYLGVLTQETVAYDMVSSDNTLKVLSTFVNGNLQMIHVLDNEGKPSLTKAASNDVEMAKQFVTNYETYTANSLYGQLKMALDEVTAGQNTTVSMGNLKLQMISVDGYTNFKWYYTNNGVGAEYSKFIALVYENGFLSGFIDNWQFYNIGSSSINVSKEQAIELSIPVARTYSWSVKLDDATLDFKNFNESNVRWATLLYDCSLNITKARSSDVLALYPVWRIGISLDKWYGQLYGIEVEIWADTKEVRSVREAWSSLPPPEEVPTANITVIGGLSNQGLPENSSSFQSSVGITNSMLKLIAISTFAITLAGVTLIWIFKKNSIINHLTERSYRKISRQAIAILLLVLMLAPVVTVCATTKTASIWGSESTGQDASVLRKSQTEITQQRSTSSTLAYYFQYYGGYNAYNNQGSSGSTSEKSHILADMQTYTSSSSRAVFVDFDHGVGGYPYTNEWHYMFEDNRGTYYDGQWHTNTAGVYDTNIYDRTAKGKTLLAFINTCLSANLTYGQGLVNGHARGMPYAFTHGRTVVDMEQTPGFNIANQMSDDGYFYPDAGSQAYIGFPWGSASLEQLLPYNGGTKHYYEWVDSFFYNSLYCDGMSINQALDHASMLMWGMWFANPYVPLRAFQAYWWPNVWPGTNCFMAIYGNGRIQLRHFGDDFQDGNYDGWTVTQGSWTVNSGNLRAQQGNSLIRTNQQFSTDRYVRTKMQTLTAGANSWDVAQVMAKYLDNNNKIYGLIHKNRNVELCVWKNGQQLVWTASSSLSYTTMNTFEINVVGNKAWVWVNGQLYLSITHDWFDDFSGYTAFYTSTGSTANFDDITVVGQSYQTPNRKLIVSSATGGSTNPSPGVYRYAEGTQVSVTAYENTGYDFNHWHVDGADAGSVNPKTITMSATHTIQPQFVLEQKYLSISTSGHGYTVPGSGYYNYGTNVQVTAYDNDGYDFSQWYLDGNPAGSANPITVTMTIDHLLEAAYVWVPYIRIDSVPGGTTDPLAGYYEGSGTQPIYAHANAGWHLDHWNLNGGYLTGAESPIYVDYNNWWEVTPVFVLELLPPYTPSVNGPTSGYVGTTYEFSAVTTDPNSDNIRYHFYWHDGTPETITGWYASGETAYASHTWNSAGQFDVTVVAEDTTGRTSTESTPTSINIENTPPPTYMLSVYAIDQQSYELNPGVSIDDQYYGTAPASFYLSAGTHTVAVDNMVYNEIYGMWEAFYYFDGYGYDNPLTIEINGDTSITAVYWINK